MADLLSVLQGAQGGQPSIQADPSSLAGSISQATPQVQPQSAMSQVRGPLGSHGILGGALGILGDMILTSAGLPAQYLPKLQQAREADAIRDFASDPQGALQKLTRVAGAKAGSDFYDSQVLDQARLASAANQMQKMQQAKLLQPFLVDQAKQKVLGTARSLVGAVKDGKTFPQAYNQVSKYLSQYGMSPDDIGLGSSYDPDNIAAVSRGGMTPEQQSNADFKSSAQEIQRGNAAETARSHRANEATASRNASTAEANAGTNIRNSLLNADRTRAQIQNYKSEADYREWLKTHPTKGRQSLFGDAGGGGAPPVGFKNKNGLTFKGGDPNDRKNWQ